MISQIKNTLLTITISFLYLSSLACGGGSSGGGESNPGPSGPPSNYEEVTSQCRAMTYAVTWSKIRDLGGGTITIAFYSSLASCQAGNAPYCQIYTDHFNGVTNCGTYHHDDGAPWTVSEMNAQWVYYQ